MGKSKQDNEHLLTWMVAVTQLIWDRRYGNAATKARREAAISSAIRKKQDSIRIMENILMDEEAAYRAANGEETHAAGEDHVDGTLFGASRPSATQPGRNMDSPQQARKRGRTADSPWSPLASPQIVAPSERQEQCTQTLAGTSRCQQCMANGVDGLALPNSAFCARHQPADRPRRRELACPAEQSKQKRRCTQPPAEAEPTAGTIPPRQADTGLQPPLARKRARNAQLPGTKPCPRCVASGVYGFAIMGSAFCASHQPPSQTPVEEAPALVLDRQPPPKRRRFARRTHPDQPTHAATGSSNDHIRGPMATAQQPAHVTRDSTPVGSTHPQPEAQQQEQRRGIG